VVIDQALIVAYHGIGPGPPPLFVGRELFREQLECLASCGARTLTMRELTTALLTGRMPPRAVALTFDDGLTSVAEEAAPLLAEHGFSATVFCVAGRLGGDNGWPTAHRAPRRPLLGAAELTELAQAGFEIGSHGMTHARLDLLPRHALMREIRDSRALLEDLVGVPVRSFAYPYGAPATGAGRSLVENAYDAACGTTLATVRPGADPYLLPRVDAHYLRRPAVLRRAVVGSFPPYLRARRAGTRARRLLVTSFAADAS
jgi:peptidoglycan/xylan/chitin deacetylase (PgdA/CDA1 family)